MNTAIRPRPRSGPGPTRPARSASHGPKTCRPTPPTARRSSSASTGVQGYDVDPETGNGNDTFGTTYTVKTDFSDIDNPTASVSILDDGDDDPTRALRSPDNLDWADDSLIYVQEDEAEEQSLSGEPLFGEDAANPNEAGIVKIDPETGELTRVATIDRSAILDPTTSGMPVDTDAGNPSEWESSGILDVSSLFGAEPGSLFLGDISGPRHRRPDRVNADSRINDGDLVEGGQLFILESTEVPDPAESAADPHNAGTDDARRPRFRRRLLGVRARRRPPARGGAG